MNRIIRARIDREALRANLAVVRAAAPGARVMAVVKANAYGHGLVPTALALSDADAFAVARLEEGLQLRSAGVQRPVVLLEGVFSPGQLAEAAQHDFEIVVHDPSQVALLESATCGHRFTIWVKVDTGMNRLGFRPEDFPAAFERLRTLTPPPRELRVLTHLARADETDCAMTTEQVARFSALVAPLSGAALQGRARIVTSIGNSAGTLGWPQARGDWVRPGLALYGVSPFPGRTGAELGLVPAMSLETSVIGVKRVQEGETVGYGGAWRATRASVVAILAAGYGDGLSRHLANGAPVRIAGELAPLAGRVSMDMIAVDVTGLAPVAVGAPALIWGPSLPVELVAEHAGTIPYELLCGVSQRVPLELH
jgi:alanine racemase